MEVWKRNIEEEEENDGIITERFNRKTWKWSKKQS